MAKVGRPPAKFNEKLFADLISIGCEEDEICWMFRSEDGKPANKDTLSRWCQRTYGMNFKEYKRQNGLMRLKIELRKNQLELSRRSAAMAIFLGKNYLGQHDRQEVMTSSDGSLDALIEGLKEPVENDIHREAESIDGTMADK